MKIFSKILLLSLIIFSSCKYDDLTETDEVQDNLLSEKIIDNVEFISNPYEIDSYISDPTDIDNEKILTQLNTIGHISRDLFKSNKYNELVFNRASVNVNQTIGFDEFVNLVDERDKSVFELSEAIEHIDLKHASTNPNNYGEIEKYVPAIYVPNIEIADKTKQPIICPGIEVNSELNGMEDYEGYIIAWIYNNKENKWIEFLLNEETAMKTTNPIFIMDNAEDELISRNKTKLAKIPTNKSYSVHHYQDSFKLYHRFESNGRSEYVITGAGVNPDGVACEVIKSSSSSTFTTSRRLEKVRKRHINKWRGDHEFLTAVEPGTDVFWNTFERDWVSSAKSLGSATRRGVTIHLYGKRRYNGDYYGPNPSYLNSHPFNTNITNSVLHFSNSAIRVKNN